MKKPNEHYWVSLGDGKEIQMKKEAEVTALLVPDGPKLLLMKLDKTGGWQQPSFFGFCNQCEQPNLKRKKANPRALAPVAKSTGDAGQLVSSEPTSIDKHDIKSTSAVCNKSVESMPLRNPATVVQEVNAAIVEPDLANDPVESGVDGSKIQEFAVKIQGKVDAVLSLDGECCQAGQMAIKGAVEAGNLLSEAKKIILHGKWERWLTENITKISQETACRWMRLANLSRMTDLTEAVSLMDAYRICGILPELGIKKPSKKKAATKKLSSSEAVLRTSSTLQRRLRQIVQGGVKVSGPERDQLKLQWRTLNDLFVKILSEESE